MSHRDELEIFVGCAPGIEEMLDRELGQLGAEKRSAIPGGVEVRCDRPQLHAIALGCGLGLSLMRRVAHFHAGRSFCPTRRAAT
jgi:23S rRNA G2445 N2-methylase RlmL